MSAEAEVLALSRRLLQVIDSGDWAAYAGLCDEGLSCFEPEAQGQLVEGLDFHKFYFDMPGTGRAKLSTICSPKVRIVGDSAIVTYVRAVQRINADGSASVSTTEETRIWAKQNGQWRHVHFHRSAPGR